MIQRIWALKILSLSDSTIVNRVIRSPGPEPRFLPSLSVHHLHSSRPLRFLATGVPLTVVVRANRDAARQIKTSVPLWRLPDEPRTRRR